jgi:hypothetical protein
MIRPNQEAVIARVTAVEQILATRQVMLQLRPTIRRGDYPETVRRMLRTGGYRLAALYLCGGCVRVVAGYRFMEMLYCGRIIYVDDLNSD